MHQGKEDLLNKTSVSFIIPAYNAEKTIARCLSSIDVLSFPKELIEVIVVDNNSTDKTKSIAQSFHKVIYVNEKQQGRSHARNNGASIASGEFLAFIDADVFLDPEWIINALDYMGDQRIGGGQGPIIPADVDGNMSLNRYRLRASSDATMGTHNMLSLALRESPMINSAACIYRKSAFEKAGCFDLLLMRHEDIDLSKRIVFAGYDLTTMSNAKAEVIYNGSGWCSYFLRSFSEGFTKVDYLRKWKGLLFSVESPYNKTILKLFYEEVIISLLHSFRTCDSYYLIRSFNAMLKSMGRIIGNFKITDFRCFSHDFVEKNQHRRILNDGKPYLKIDLRNLTIKKI
jgi:glycosyltransferase involved in cell wall biosynthesis